MLVQTYLRAGHSLAELSEQYGIKVVEDDDLCVLNYSIDSPATGLSDDCRGLILRKGTWEVVSFSFRRFFNFHEQRASTIDWDTALVQEKVDGSLIVFYHNGREWDLQTRGTIHAEGEVPAKNGSFRKRVLALIDAQGGLCSLLAGQPRNHCFVCEYVGPYNRVVTPYEHEDLYFLATTDRNTCRDVDAEIDESRGLIWPWSRPRLYDVGSSIGAISEAAATLPPLAEGYVVVDADWRRVKVKNPAYLAVARTVNAGAVCSDRHFAAIALSGDTSEIKAYFPDFAGRIDAHEAAQREAIDEAELLWGQWGRERDRKTYALGIKHAKLSAWLFQKHQGKTALQPAEWMRENVRPERAAEWIGKDSQC